MRVEVRAEGSEEATRPDDGLATDKDKAWLAKFATRLSTVNKASANLVAEKGAISARGTHWDCFT